MIGKKNTFLFIYRRFSSHFAYAAFFSETKLLGTNLFCLHYLFQGSTAYVPQQAWIQNATLQENVFFGQSRDPERYKHVISACALDPDIEVLPAGDVTEIGEKVRNIPIV